MNEEFLRNILFPVIRAGMDMKVGKVDISEDDCNKLMYIGRTQDILPIISRGLSRMGITGNAASKIDEACRKDIYRFAVQDNALTNISAIFEDEKISYMPLKGSVLRDLYPEKWLRTASDIDILVHEEDLDKAVNILESKTYFKKKNKADHDVQMFGKDVHLELHYSILRDAENINKMLSDVWNNAERYEDTSRFLMNTDYLVFYIVAHMYSHFQHGGLGIRPYIDLWLLKSKSDFNESRLNEMIRYCGITKFYDSCCHLIDVWFNDAKHTEVSSMIENVCLRGGALGSLENSIAIYKKDHSTLQYILHLYFLNRKSFEFMYPVLKEKPYLLPFYRIKRAIRILKKSRKKVYGTLETVKKVDQTNVESIDNILTILDM